ncbi:endonuclease/exonuclease/phosphatase family protein [Actinomycetospora endophytica]|uniref:Endonuclease/exonuclease/phosphatase family protein n=1 Tax=Actinomycetospora endophytica TaxID=2291215 RepID=A0ABS8P148_9PSEU|nr:endonuclease/exonuclease/phosphatase family protein [Actinomycetospora endophytica]MCD2191970.1 endonuclease/exonuclease/phosphatase family protein [Actinomycetospora endophytica]
MGGELPERGRRALRVASLNIAAGRGPDGRADPHRLWSALQELDADVLALQEVDRGQERSGRIDQAELAAAVVGVTGPEHVRFEATVGRLPAARRGRDTGPTRHREPAAMSTATSVSSPGYGIALVSRVPVRRWRRVELPGFPARPWRSEPRVALAAVLAEPAPVRTIVTTHLSVVPALNAIQARRLAAALSDLPGPVILLGDLNLPAAIPARLLPAWRPLGRGSTYPRPRPRLRLDQALLRDPGRAGPPADWTAGVVPTGISDHCAVTVDLA